MKYPALFFWLLGLVALASQDMAHPSADQARDLWQKMLAAKGVNQVPIRSFVISSTAVSGSAKFNIDAGSERSTIVGSFPGKWWSFDDHRPGKLGYSVTAYDFGSHEGWISFSGGPAQVIDNRGRVLEDRWLRTMATYFCETEGFKPTPKEASRMGGYEVVKASWNDQTLVYYLEPSTHLPKKLEILRVVDFTVPAHGDIASKTASKLNTTPVEMEEYHSINGIQVPARVKLWDSWDRVRVDLNVDLPLNLFITPPANVTTAEDWKRTTPSEK